MRGPVLTAAALSLPSLAAADFADNNLLAIFYHELGHAIIHQMQVPIFGQEEDAADALSILLIDALYEPDAALTMAYDSALLFWSDAQNAPVFWDTHGPDEQRFYNTVCLFYGADPDLRDDFADDMDLPDARAETCPDEFDLASDSWNAVLDEMAADRRLTGQLILQNAQAHAVLASEIAQLNAEFRWPQDVKVHVAACDEPNAYYDLGEISITMCRELVGWLDDVALELDAR